MYTWIYSRTVDFGIAHNGTGTENCDNIGNAFVPATEDYKVQQGHSGLNGQCESIVTQWDISSIPDFATIIDVDFQYYLVGATTSFDCNYIQFTDNDFANISAQNAHNNVTSNTVYTSNVDCGSTASSTITIDLGETAVADLQSQLSEDLYSLAVVPNPLQQAGAWRQTTMNALELQVTYTPPTQEQMDILELQAEIIDLQNQITSVNGSLSTLDSKVSTVDTLVDYIDTFLDGLFINYEP